MIRGLPWFLIDISNYQLITSGTIPEGTIKDRKSIVITETPIPGRNSQPVSFGGNGNRKVSFTLPIIRRNDIYGDILIIKQFDALRNQASGFMGLTKKGQFLPNPKVLYYWGIGSVPLLWYVTKCDFQHTANMVNVAAYPQHTLVEMELTLDEDNDLYKAEAIFRGVSQVLGVADSALELTMGAGRKLF